MASAPAIDVDKRWTWLQAHPFANEPLCSEGFHKEEDVVFSGSEDDHYDDPTERHRRYEERGRQFLSGQPPLILSASLRGPFERASGWINPWRAKGGRAVEKVTDAPPKKDKKPKRKKAAKKAPRRTRAQPKAIEHDADQDEADEEQASDERHASADHATASKSFAEESRASKDVQVDNPYMDEADIARVQDWRDGIHSKALPRESFWVEKTAGSRKRVPNPEWLRSKLAKRSQLSIADDETIDSPTNNILQTRLAAGLVPSDVDSAAHDEEMPDEHTMASFQSPLAFRRTPGLIAPHTSPSEQADPAADSMSVDELSQDSPMPCVPSISPRDRDITRAEDQSPLNLRGKTGGKDGIKKGPIGIKRKNRAMPSSGSQEGPHMLRRSLRTKENRKHDGQDLAEEPQVLADDKEPEKPVFESQQDDSFYFRAKPRRGECNTDTPVEDPEVEVAMALVPEEPESPSPLLEMAEHPVPESSQPLPTISSSIRLRPRRAVRAPKRVHNRISIDEPTIVELGSPAPSNYSRLKASPAKRRIAAENSPASTSDLSDVPSYACTEVDHSDIARVLFKSAGSKTENNPIPTRYDTVKGVDQEQGDRAVVPEEEIAVPSQYEDLKRGASRDAEVSGSFINDTTLLPNAPTVPETYAEIKGRHLAPESNSTPTRPEIGRMVMGDKPDEEEPSGSQAQESVGSDLPPAAVSEVCFSDALPDISSKGSQAVQDEMAVDVNDDPAESDSEEEDEGPDDSALVILPLSNEAWGISEETPSAPMMDSSTQSMPDDEVASTASRPDTPKIGTQDQSPWAVPHGSPKQQNGQMSPRKRVQVSGLTDAGVQMASPEVAEQHDQSENQSPWRSQELSSAAEAAMPCLGSSFTHKLQGSDNSQDLPSPLPERNVLASTSGNRMQSPNPARPSTPDTKHSSLPTPDFTLSIKQFRRLLSASPERRPSARTSIGSILSNPWSKAAKPPRRVHFAPLPGEEADDFSSPSIASQFSLEDDNDEDYIEAGLPKQQRRRRIRAAKPEPQRTSLRAASPPPMASLQDLPDEVDRFKNHYDAMEGRRSKGRSVRLHQRLLPSASQQIVGSPAIGAMADRFLAADSSINGGSATESASEDLQGKGREKEQMLAEKAPAQEVEPEVDDVSAVMDNLEDFLGGYDVDKEVDLARAETGESAGKRRSLFSAGLELDVGVWG